MSPMVLIWSLLAVIATANAARAADAPNVVVSIPPLHGLVSDVMAGVGEPILLLDGGATPHGTTLRPSASAASPGFFSTDSKWEPPTDPPT